MLQLALTRVQTNSPFSFRLFRELEGEKKQTRQRLSICQICVMSNTTPTQTPLKTNNDKENSLGLERRQKARHTHHRHQKSSIRNLCLQRTFRLCMLKGTVELYPFKVGLGVLPMSHWQGRCQTIVDIKREVVFWSVLSNDFNLSTVPLSTD